MSSARPKKKVNAQPDTKKAPPDPEGARQAPERQTTSRESQTSTGERQSGNGSVSSLHSEHKPRKPHYYHSRGGRHNRRGNDTDRGRGFKTSEREAVRGNFREKKNGYRTGGSGPVEGRGGEGAERRRKDDARVTSKTRSNDVPRHREEGSREHRTEGVVAPRPRDSGRDTACSHGNTSV